MTTSLATNLPDLDFDETEAAAERTAHELAVLWRHLLSLLAPRLPRLQLGQKAYANLLLQHVETESAAAALKMGLGVIEPCYVFVGNWENMAACWMRICRQLVALPEEFSEDQLCQLIATFDEHQASLGLPGDAASEATRQSTSARSV